MKDLLVAIDFSKNAIHALEYALLYAGKLNSDIKLVWVDNTVSPDLAISSADGEFRHDSRMMFKEILARYDKKYPGIKMDYKLCKGKVYEEISKYARKIGADLIFSGTHGVTGFEKYWIGSNAYRIVTHSPCPVITLRQDFAFGKGIKTILLPVDNTLQSSKKVFTAAQIAETFGSYVQVLALHTSSLGSLKRQVDKQLGMVSEHLEKHDIAFSTEQINTTNITQDTIEFATKNKVDLIAIMTEQETTQANVFLGTFARQLVNNCPVPVLSVREPAGK